MSIILTTTIPSPVGDLHLLSTEEGVLALGLPNGDPRKLEARASDKLRLPVSESASEFAVVSQQLAEYFAGSRQRFSLPIDWRLTQGFTGLVAQAINKIPYAESISYGQIADLVGRPGGAQAVGQACGRNPLPIIVPCHRVLGSGQKLGGYGGGAEMKKKLLALEHIAYK